MHGAAVQFASSAPRGDDFDLLLVTDMLDLATLRGLRPDLAKLPTVLYMHENQLTTPWSPTDPDTNNNRDRRYGWINYTSTQAADQIWFASNYHLAVFAEALPSFLSAFPKGSSLPSLLPEKCKHMPLPLSIGVLAKAERPIRKGPPVILWNHRWEFDKGPNEFWSIIDQLDDEGVDFKLIVCGESYNRQPPVFAKAEKRHQKRILHWGFVESQDAYHKLLLQSTFALITSKHDFFGISVVEALAAGVRCLLPTRMPGDALESPYAAHVTQKEWQSTRYETREDCLTKIRKLLEFPGVSVSGDPQLEVQRRHVLKYEASTLTGVYDDKFEKLAAIQAS